MYLKDISKITGGRINTDTSKERDMIVTSSNRNLFRFKQCASGLYYYDTKKHDDDDATNGTHKTKRNFNSYSMLKTENNNKE